MAFLSYSNLNLAGLAVAVPKNSESNQDYPFPTEQEKQLFIKMTGVENRRKSTGQLCSDLCFEAAEQLLEKLQWEKESVELLIFVSQSRDYILPSTSIILQDRLGLPDSCICMDVPLGCSGYVYGLSMMAAFISSGQIKRGLLLAGDTSSFTVNPKDKSTYPLFGDAGSATAIEWKGGAPEWQFILGSDGSGSEHIIIPGGHCRQPYTEEQYVEKMISPGIIRNESNLQLNGEEVFHFSVTRVPKSVRELFEKTGCAIADIDIWLMHQANRLMNETIRIKMKCDTSKVPYSLGDFGNTSSASIPLTMVVDENDYHSKKLLMSGFGVGLSWANLVFATENPLILDLIEM